MTTEPATPNSPDAQPLDFGPGGYLPERASKRARKIVLRAPMGIQWVIGSLVVGVIVVIAGVIALQDGPPDAPYVALGPVGEVSVFGKDVQLQPLGGPGFGEIFVLTEGRPRVFQLAGEQPRFCAASGLLEGSSGGTWRTTGRGLGGTASLVEHPSLVHEGTLYADPTNTVPLLPPDDTVIEQQCGAPAPGPTPFATEPEPEPEPES